MTLKVNPSSMERIYIFPTSCLNDFTNKYSPMKRKVMMSPWYQLSSTLPLGYITPHCTAAKPSKITIAKHGHCIALNPN